MKRNFSLLLFCVITSLFMSCISIGYIGIKLDQNVYMDQTEVPVEAWLSYYSWKYKNEGKIEAKKTLPDSTAVEIEVWDLFKSKTQEYNTRLNIYTRFPIGYFPTNCEFIDYNKNIDPVTIPKTTKCPFLNFPITGLTYEQVVDFCKWKTKYVGNEIIEYRLPTEKEWEDFAFSGLTGDEMKNSMPDSVEIGKICPQFNYKFTKLCGHLSGFEFKLSQQYTIGSFSGLKNKVYDLFGSVSEMTSEKGIAKGGNYMIYANSCHIDSIQSYSKPEIWLGFRCVSIKK